MTLEVEDKVFQNFTSLSAQRQIDRLAGSFEFTATSDDESVFPIKTGQTTVIAIDGQEGVEMARTEQPDLILMDLSLTKIDGWEATRQIKADERISSIPVIALTAHALSRDRDKALEVGCDDYDTKPIDLTRLLNKMQVLLDRAAASD